MPRKITATPRVNTNLSLLSRKSSVMSGVVKEMYPEATICSCLIKPTDFPFAQLETRSAKTSCGDTYEGQVNKKTGQKHGRGTYDWNNGPEKGDRYVGDWVNDKREGYGIYYFANGNKYEGEWMKDNKHGLGVMTWADGNTYKGECKVGNRSGKGKITWNNGNSYEGYFYNGEPYGRGTYYWASGDKFEGIWQNGERHGEGMYTWSNGKKEKQIWKYGKEV
ncbi:unnamed protein product [Moneuplotes crassus]|uniref:Uncharacterized protein n=1 Tax=Euplotes crassus TaxID=5936 RepID=A0AAD2D3J3_EUPCR|nr:unnamed protein product [Moneuplotes crassus]